MKKQTAKPESVSRASGSDDLKSLLKDALPSASRPPGVLNGVQQRIRQGSRGKFYEDGWSTSKHPPMSTYLITSLVMLAVIFALYAVLGPLSAEVVEVEMAPAPVRLVPPHSVHP